MLITGKLENTEQEGRLPVTSPCQQLPSTFWDVGSAALSLCGLKAFPVIEFVVVCVIFPQCVFV